MTKTWKKLTLVALAACFVATSIAQGGAISDKRRAQNKLLAYRAARADAIRKLAEQIKGLQISSETSVRDFVTESDTINTALRTYLVGMREVGRPRYMEDGTCEVDMQIKLKSVAAALKSIHKAHYTSKKIKISQFDKMDVYNKVKIIKVTGMGAPRPELEEEEPLSIVGDGTPLNSFSHLTGEAKEYWMARCTGRGRLMAVRAARVDAFRRLAERIQGVRLSSTTTVRDFVTESDEINAATMAFIRGAKEIGIRYHKDELIVEVELQVKLRSLLVQLKNASVNIETNKRISVREFDQLIMRNKDTVIREIGMGVPPEKYLKNVTVIEQEIMSTAAGAPGWITQTYKMTGQGAIDDGNTNAAQAKLMAYRAAELDARRKIAEYLDGLVITSNTSVRDFVAEADEIDTAMLTFQQGARVIEGSQKLMEDGTAEVTVEIELKPLWNMILFYQKKLNINIR